MKNGKEILCSILKTTQTGQVRIRSVLDSSMRPSLRKTLESQLQEYNSIESEVHAVAAQRGWDLPELDPAVRVLRDLSTRAKLHGTNSDSKIADMMILGNTKGLIRGLKNIHQFPGTDQQICILSQKLLDCETANIRQMQSFL